jgi:putative FmdB family regulatory protein
VPRYQYACTVPECGHEFEAVQSFSDDALTACPACEGRLRKVFGAVGVVFKGSGFYRTDSRADSRGGSRDERAGGAEKTGGAEKSGTDNSGTGGGATKRSDKGGDAKGSASTGSPGSQSSASGSTKAAAASSA